jgi:hypothetical protein
MSLVGLPPGKPSPRFDPALPVVAPEALTPDCDLAGYPIAPLGHVRIYHYARVEDRQYVGFTADQIDSSYTDAFLHAIDGQEYRVTPHTRVRAGRVVVLHAEDRKPIRIPVNGSRAENGAIVANVARLVRPFSTWRLPDQAEECMCERVDQGLYAIRREIAVHAGAAAWDAIELRLMQSLRDDLEEAFALRDYPWAQRHAVWNHVRNHARDDQRDTIVSLYGGIARILHLSEPVKPSRPGEEFIGNVVGTGY